MPGLSKEKRIEAFCRLGDIISDSCLENNKIGQSTGLRDIIDTQHLTNKWFTPESIRQSLLSIASWLNTSALTEWLAPYSVPEFNTKNKNIAIVMAGNIPLVGFHDFLCVLITGNSLSAKVSSKDNLLIKEIVNILIELEPGFDSYINLSDSLPACIDAVIATGSDNSARYFEYNYGSLPHIFRKNRNSVAIINNSTSDKELLALGGDIFDYYGLGCRNVSKIFIPKGFDTYRLESAWQSFKKILQTEPYLNNYKYNKALLNTENKQFLDLGNVLLVESSNINSAVSVLNFSYYNDKKEISSFLELYSNQLQIVIGENYYPYGSSQSPALSDYADNIDTLEFLAGL